jgi:nitrite reductase/ring-hydroxylating ferredoxin subunit
MPLVRVASLSQLPPGTLIEVVADGQAIALCNAGGEIHALDGVCPHNGGPLGQGALHETAVVCPWHAWEFDCRTGELDYNPEVRVRKYAVTIDGDDVLIDVEAGGARAS